MFIVAVSQSLGRRRIRDQVGVTLLAENEQQQGQEVPRHVSPRHAHHDPGPGEGWVCQLHVSRVSRGKVPGGGDPAVTNSHLLPQQDCPVFTGDCVMNGAFKKISNAVCD